MLVVQLFIAVLLFGQDYSDYMIIMQEGDNENDRKIIQDCIITVKRKEVLFEYKGGTISYKKKMKLGNRIILENGYSLRETEIGYFLSNKKRELYYFYHTKKLYDVELTRKLKAVRGINI